MSQVLNGWVVGASSENGEGDRATRTDDELRSGTSSASRTTGTDRRLPDVPEQYRDTALDVLANPWSRFVFYYVRDRAHRSVSVTTLTDDLLAWMPDDDRSDVSRSEVAEALWEHHLPALAAQGLLTVDRETGTVRYVGRGGIDEALAAQSEWDPNELLSRS